MADDAECLLHFGMVYYYMVTIGEILERVKNKVLRLHLFYCVTLRILISPLQKVAIPFLSL